MKTITIIWMLYWPLLEVIADSANIYHVKTNETVDLENFVNCGTWKKDYKNVSNKFSMTKDKIGLYFCEPKQIEIFVFTVDNDMTFESNPPLKEFVIGDNVTFSCFVKFQSLIDTIQSDLRIHNSTHLLNNHSESATQAAIEGKTSASIKLDTGGTIMYSCSWTYSTISRFLQSEVSGTDILNISLKVYVPTRNVRPDKTKAQVNTTVTCLSDADPVAKYHWKCDRSSFNSSESTIAFLETGVYNCTCNATNKIFGKEYQSQWSGVIEVVTEEELREGRSNGEIIGIVIGSLVGLAAVVLVFFFIYRKLKKDGRVVARKKDKNKVAEAGKEHLEVVENSLYARP